MTSQEKPLPKIVPLNGALCRQWVRCGKPNCRCTSGKLHGPYWYRFGWSDGRVYKVYVRKADLPAVQEAIAAWQWMQKTMRLFNQIGWGNCPEPVLYRLQTLMNASLGLDREVATRPKVADTAGPGSDSSIKR